MSQGRAEKRGHAAKKKKGEGDAGAAAGTGLSAGMPRLGASGGGLSALLGAEDAGQQGVARKPAGGASEVKKAPPSAAAQGGGQDDASLAAGQVQWKLPPGFPARWGSVTFSKGDLKAPQFKLKERTSGTFLTYYSFEIERQSGSTGSWTACAVPVNENGYKVDKPHDECPEYPTTYVIVSPKAANLLAQAEQQHLDDLDRALELTFFPIEDAINQAAQEEPVESRDKKEARKAAVKKVLDKLPGPLRSYMGSDFEKEDIQSELVRIIYKAAELSRKGRDDSGKHTVEIALLYADEEKQAALAEAKPSDDKTPTSAIISPGKLFS